MELNNIHQQFHRLLTNYISKRVNNKHDVQDLLQEVFIKIYTNLPSANNKDNLKSWLFTITKNTITDYYRKKSRATIFSGMDHAINAEIEEIEFDRTKDMEKCLGSFIPLLPADYRDIIIDSEIKGVKQKDLAEKYKLAYSSVRSRVQRGRAKLKEMFLACCKIELDRRGNILEVIPQPKKCCV